MTLSTQPEARAYARTRWALLRDRLSTITPEAIGRGALAVGVIALSVSLAVGSWPALAPFIAGLSSPTPSCRSPTASTGSCPASWRR